MTTDTQKETMQELSELWHKPDPELNARVTALFKELAGQKEKAEENLAARRNLTPGEWQAILTMQLRP